MIAMFSTHDALPVTWPNCRQPGHYTRFGVTSGWPVIQELDQFFGLKPHQPLRKELL
ncbi:MAG: hypothetical protein QOI94_267 [Acidobacteriaceae bacterium]|jgi:hypothetical protein|nr:hypothetical protein [Acidobacteriaceae bacterium]